MAILSQAPLIEVIFELRWGKASIDPQGKSIQFQNVKGELERVQPCFAKTAADRGFGVTESVNQGIQVPYVVTHRYRRAPNTWPCYQIGIGIFTVNQVNDGYDWITFKKDILSGLEILDTCLPGSLSEVPRIGVELRYQDGFTLGENETPIDFLRSKMALDFQVPAPFLASQKINNNAQIDKISFHVPTIEPEGIFINEIGFAHINGYPGFVMSSVVRSAEGNSPDFTLKKLDHWLNEAHAIQRHAFETLIHEAYARTFQ
jgi:uncharacterized protein (TIGR04255 family)